MSDTILFNRDKLIAQLRDTERESLEHITTYVEVYERMLRVLEERDYPSEVRVHIAAALAAAWVKSCGD